MLKLPHIPSQKVYYLNGRHDILDLVFLHCFELCIFYVMCPNNFT